MIRRVGVFILAVLFASHRPEQAEAQAEVRVATYNIKFFSDRTFNCGSIPVTRAADQGDRLVKLRELVERLDADVIGLQEIDRRTSLEQIFPASEWDILIDNESDDCQDVAIVARKPLTVRGCASDTTNAASEDFLFAEDASNSFFPGRRDVLCGSVAVPGKSSPLIVLVHHAKSRLGGRSTTNSRRVGAARKIREVLEAQFDENDYVLLGDFNDNPDDEAPNVLETGNPNALASMEEVDGPFLINLTEMLAAQDRVSHGLTNSAVSGDQIDTVDPGSRMRNFSNIHTDVNTGKILFDQLLIPMRMNTAYVDGSAAIFDHAIAVRGNSKNRCSDHLPVYADFVFATDDGSVDGDAGPPASNSVRIVGLMPNPSGSDVGKETVTLRNLSGTAVSLTGWTLVDRAGNTFQLPDLSIAAGQSVVVTMSVASMPLNNDGDELTLKAPDSAPVHTVSYSAEEVTVNGVISFGG